MDSLRTMWWLVLIRGIAAIAFGAAAFLAPKSTLIVLWILLALFVLVDGVALVVTAFVRLKDDPQWWITLLQGVVVLLVGGLFVWKAQASAAVAFWLLGLLLVVAGVVQVVQGWRLRKEIDGEWLLMLGGVLWAVFGVFFLIDPLTAAQAFVWVIGIWAVASGVLSIVLAFRIRKQAGAPGGSGGGPMTPA